MKRKLIATSLAAMMLFSMAMPACAEESSDGASQYQTTYGSKQFDDVTISVELFDRSNAPEGSTILENRWTQYAQEAMAAVGINLEFVAVPRGDEVSKMQTMVGSGTAPTLTFTYTYTYARDYYKDGGTWDLSEFVDGEDQAQNLKAYIGDNCLSLGRNADGSLVGIVARRATTAQSNLFIRKDWLDDLGLEVPTTADELQNALHEMVYNNPDGNSNVVGIVLPGMTDAYLASYRDAESLSFMENVKDEKLMAVGEGYEYYTDNGYREYLRWVNALYNDGLMDKEFFATTDDIMQSNFVNGKLAAYDSNVGHNVDILRGGLLQSLKNKDEDAEFVAINFMESSVYEGEIFAPAYGEGGLIIFIPKTYSAEEVEAAITYLDWLSTSEGGFTIYHGIEGEHFNYNEDGVPIPIDAEYNQTDKDWIRTDLFLVGNQGYFTNVDDFNLNIAADNPGWEEYTISDYELSLDGTQIQSAQYMYATDIEMDLANDLGLLAKEWKVKCITCSPDEFDANYDQWIAAAEDVGIQEIIETRTAVYEEIKGE